MIFRQSIMWLAQDSRWCACLSRNLCASSLCDAFFYDFQFRFMLSYLRHRRALRTHSLTSATHERTHIVKTMKRLQMSMLRNISLVSLTQAQLIMVSQQHQRELSHANWWDPESKHCSHIRSRSPSTLSHKLRGKQEETIQLSPHNKNSCWLPHTTSRRNHFAVSLGAIRTAFSIFLCSASWVSSQLSVVNIKSFAAGLCVH